MSTTCNLPGASQRRDASTPVRKLPKWLRDLDASLSIRSQFVLSGNVRDYVLAGDEDIVASTLVEALWVTLEPRGFQGILIWDPVDGLHSFPEDRKIEMADRRLSEPGKTLAELAELLRQVAVPPRKQSGESPQLPVALVVDFASRISELFRSPAELFAAAEKASALSRLIPRADRASPACFNPIIWLANRANDLPFWLTTDNQRIASISVPLPSADERQIWAAACYDNITKQDIDRDSFAKELAELTHGMMLLELGNITKLAGANGLKASQTDDAAERYRVGDVEIDENPWRTAALRERIAQGGEKIEQFVKGQSRAKLQVLDILKRTAIGLTGAQAPSSGARPRGILFFAGPSGVGKTEMAKTIARIVFGNPDACLRFDMSEFKGEHSGDRLIGAPPGYLGFDQGGELTNAMRENPFRVLLFDEIEKAHPRILDKFLQILEDGRLTDGSGETVYFSESLIVFTSNVGIVRRDEHIDTVERLVTRQDQLADANAYERRILEGVKNHFHLELQRPELHNRLGDNIVVFNYILEDIAAKIIDGMVKNVRAACQEDTSVDLQLTDDALGALKSLCMAEDVLDNGGRGIGAKLEAVLVNPLARYLFDKNVGKGVVEVKGFRPLERGSAYELII